jgi:histidinol-phosphate/aromatic aminotransferase/cobyric acid decarboxylase-like protein
MEPSRAFHGGRSFEAIGEDFKTLGRAAQIVRADVLDAWFDPAPNVLEKLRDFLPFLARSSPPAYSRGLIDAIAAARGIPPEGILSGAGSSDLIFTCLPRLVHSGQRVLILDPMYGEYRHVFESVIGAELMRFRLSEEAGFQVEVNRLIDEIRRVRPGFVVLVNPNSPTGRFIPRDQLIQIADALPEHAKLLVDETYIEYAGSHESVEKEACARPNLLVLKSMSKVYALSGLRVGYLAAAPATIRDLARTMPPWAVSLPAQVAAVEALANPDYYRQRYAETHNLRADLVQALAQGDVHQGCGNFVLVKVKTSAEAILRHMSDSHGVHVRNCDSMGACFHDNFLRISVMTPNQNRRIAEAFASTLASVATSR